ncbi:MAG: hypothetical protein HYX41_04470 [Bdellovibrio sp.]|nr:hypothetical protein [Bdellovibrio sp.]
MKKTSDSFQFLLLITALSLGLGSRAFADNDPVRAIFVELQQKQREVAQEIGEREKTDSEDSAQLGDIKDAKKTQKKAGGYFKRTFGANKQEAKEAHAEAKGFTRGEQAIQTEIRKNKEKLKSLEKMRLDLISDEAFLMSLCPEMDRCSKTVSRLRLKSAALRYHHSRPTAETRPTSQEQRTSGLDQKIKVCNERALVYAQGSTIVFTGKDAHSQLTQGELSFIPKIQNSQLRSLALFGARLGNRPWAAAMSKAAIQSALSSGEANGRRDAFMAERLQKFASCVSEALSQPSTLVQNAELVQAPCSVEKPDPKAIADLSHDSEGIAAALQSEEFHPSSWDSLSEGSAGRKSQSKAKQQPLVESKHSTDSENSFKSHSESLPGSRDRSNSERSSNKSRGSADFRSEELQSESESSTLSSLSVEGQRSNEETAKIYSTLAKHLDDLKKQASDETQKEYLDSLSQKDESNRAKIVKLTGMLREQGFASFLKNHLPKEDWAVLAALNSSSRTNSTTSQKTSKDSESSEYDLLFSKSSSSDSKGKTSQEKSHSPKNDTRTTSEILESAFDSTESGKSSAEKRSSSEGRSSRKSSSLQTALNGVEVALENVQESTSQVGSSHSEGSVELSADTDHYIYQELLKEIQKTENFKALQQPTQRLFSDWLNELEPKTKTRNAERLLDQHPQDTKLLPFIKFLPDFVKKKHQELIDTLLTEDSSEHHSTSQSRSYEGVSDSDQTISSTGEKDSATHESEKVQHKTRTPQELLAGNLNPSKNPWKPSNSQPAAVQKTPSQLRLAITSQDPISAPPVVPQEPKKPVEPPKDDSTKNTRPDRKVEPEKPTLLQRIFKKKAHEKPYTLNKGEVEIQAVEIDPFGTARWVVSFPESGIPNTERLETSWITSAIEGYTEACRNFPTTSVKRQIKLGNFGMSPPASREFADLVCEQAKTIPAKGANGNNTKEAMKELRSACKDLDRVLNPTPPKKTRQLFKKSVPEDDPNGSGEKKTLETASEPRNATLFQRVSTRKPKLHEIEHVLNDGEIIVRKAYISNLSYLGWIVSFDPGAKDLRVSSWELKNGLEDYIKQLNAFKGPLSEPPRIKLQGREMSQNGSIQFADLVCKQTGAVDTYWDQTKYKRGVKYQGTVPEATESERRKLLEVCENLKKAQRKSTSKKISFERKKSSKSLDTTPLDASASETDDSF